MNHFSNIDFQICANWFINRGIYNGRYMAVVCEAMDHIVDLKLVEADDTTLQLFHDPIRKDYSI